MRYPLDDIRVLDMGWVVAGPQVGKLLADAGAQVIKVETYKRVDALRMGPDNLIRDVEGSPAFANINRGKRSVTVDLTTPLGEQVLRELAVISDVVISNFAPGVMAKHGLDYPSLSRLNPGIVVLALSGTGQQGPLRDVAAYGPTVTALGGMDALVGYPGERVLGLGAFGDANAAVYGTYGVLSAIYHMKQTGRGQFVDLSEWETAISTIGEEVLAYTITGKVPQPQGNEHPLKAPHNVYRCKGEDAWVALSVSDDAEWVALCRATGHPEMATDPRYSGAHARLQHRKEIDAVITEWTRPQDAHGVAAALQRHGVAAAPWLDIGDRLTDPHFQRMFQALPHPRLGTVRHTAVSWDLSRTPAGFTVTGPTTGEGNDFAFKELLCLRDGDYAGLTQQATAG